VKNPIFFWTKVFGPNFLEPDWPIVREFLVFRMSERSKRSRNKGNDARQAALDKIRNARQSGTVADYDIGEVDNIFEEVDEDEYEVWF